MAVSTTSASELTAEQVVKILVKPLEEAAKFLAAGPRIFDTASPIRIPKLGAPRRFRGSVRTSRSQRRPRTSTKSSCCPRR